jgi:hypothetical protein
MTTSNSNKGKQMYFITGLQKLEVNDKGWLDQGAQRTFGYYENFDDAENAVIHNHADIHECLYNYMLIEKIEPGLYAHCLSAERWLYKYNPDYGTFYSVKEPPEMDHYCNFAVG